VHLLCERRGASLAIALLLAGGVLAWAQPAAATAAPAVQVLPSPGSRTVSPGAQSPSGAAHRTERVCPDNGKRLVCLAVRQTDPSPPLVVPNTSSAGVAPMVVPNGFAPADLRSAYNLTAGGSGAMTVAIVGAYDAPNAESDLATYRSTYGLPACTSGNGCFRKVNENGQPGPLPTPDGGWAGEMSLDVDMVSAICPGCHILLVEARQPLISDLGTAVNTAVGLGAKFVSNSYGGPEDGSESSYDVAYYTHPGVAVTASSGDAGYGVSGVSYPASGKGVTAVGGTSLSRSSAPRGWAETAWSNAGSGCSTSVAQPGFQSGLTTGCTSRAVADVAAVADPQTGVAVYQTYGAATAGWQVYGGTSVAAPIVASIYALAGNPGAADSPNTYPYARSGSLYDVTAGSNGTCGAPLCTAGPGYDGPTGLGTPRGTAAFASASTDPIVAHYTAVGGSGSYLGNPVGGEYDVAGGRGQDYTGGSIFYSASTGAWAVHGAILGTYRNLGGPGGVLSFPTSDETPTPDGVGRFNAFAGTGRSGIYWTPNTGAHEVQGAIYGDWASLGYERGPLGYPTSDEIPTPDGVGRFNAFAGTGRSGIYWTPNTGAHAVQGAIYGDWASLGYERGPLGYPTSDETPTPDGVGRFNAFAGTGRSGIYWTPNTGAHEVQGAIYAQWASLGYERSGLGYPTSDEYAIPGGRGNDFTGGTITWQASTGTTQTTYR